MAAVQYSIAFVTTSGTQEARKIAKGLVGEGLAACCNIIPKVTSIFNWEGKVEDDTESLMVIKTRKSLQKKVIKRVRQLHSYDVPEVIFFPLEAGEPDYMKWLKDVTAPGASKK